MEKLVIFDIDGVVLKSNPAWIWAFSEATKGVGIKPTDRDIVSHFGEMDKEILKALVKSDYSSDKFKKGYEEFMKIIQSDEFYKKISLTDDAEKTLKQLKSKGYTLAVLSSNSNSVLKNLFSKFKLSEYFDVIVGSDDVKRGKPSPDGLIKIMTKLNFSPENTIFIGDTNIDIQAAKSANVTSVAVLTGTLNKKEAEDIGPDFIIKSIANILKILYEGVHDLNLKKQTIREFVEDSYTSGGFTSRNMATGAKIAEEMIRDPNYTTFFSFPACIVSTGLRGIIRDMVKYKMVNVIVTTCGTLDHDIARTWKDYYYGSFDMDDKRLHREGIHRLGNILIPKENYGMIIEDKVKPMLAEIYKEKKELATYELVWELGKRINDESSILYWAWKNQIPIFVPGITDGAVGLQLWMFSQDHSDFRINVLKDEQKLSDITFEAKKVGAIIVGGGISKHHTIWWNQFRGGLDSAVYITTAVEWDGSLSGARPKEAISWGKLKEKAKEVTVDGDATIILPLLVNYVWAGWDK